MSFVEDLAKQTPELVGFGDNFDRFGDTFVSACPVM